MSPQELLTKLNKEIPLSRHLGFDFLEASAQRVRIKARLTENINHKGTAFGGSIYTLSVLAAYSLVYLGLDQEKVPTNNIVIQKADIDYLKPVTGDFEILCEFKGTEAYEKFYEALGRWKKVRDKINVSVSCQGQVCAKLTGLFVVQL
jgi:thioesterase domain-containing protein